MKRSDSALAIAAVLTLPLAAGEEPADTLLRIRVDPVDVELFIPKEARPPGACRALYAEDE